MRVFLLIGSVVLVLFLAPLFLAVERPEQVSLIQLIARPEKYDGRLINIIGYLSLDREHSALYLHKEDFDHSLMSNAVSVHPTEAMLRDRQELRGRYVILIGVFRAGERGRLDPSVVGGMTDINRCEEWTMGRMGRPTP